MRLTRFVTNIDALLLATEHTPRFLVYRAYQLDFEYIKQIMAKYGNYIVFCKVCWQCLHCGVFVQYVG